MEKALGNHRHQAPLELEPVPSSSSSSSSSARVAGQVAIGAVVPDDLGRAWPMVLRWVEAALEHSVSHELRAVDVLAMLEAAEAVLLLAEVDHRIVACAVVRSGCSAQGVPYTALVCAGGNELEAWLEPMVRAVREIGYATGAKEVLIHGRRGWYRRLRPYGLEQVSCVMRADLTSGPNARQH